MLQRITVNLRRGWVWRRVALLLGLALLGIALICLAAACGSAAVSDQAASGSAAASATCAIPSPADGSAPASPRAPMEGETETAAFAAGCFWGVEAHFAALPGVADVVVGYTGGTTEDPTYEDVCSASTGHAEAVRVEYDPDVITYEELVEDFFAMHDPTTLDRQGPDSGSQYRSAIFFHTPEQKATAQAVMECLEKGGEFGAPIVTEITAAGPFWPAEDYHQDYYEQ